MLAEPTIRHTSSDGQEIKALRIGNESMNGLRRLSRSGVQANIHTPHTGWVIHRHTRSELEYAAKSLYPFKNLDDSPFKSNREGYLVHEESVQSRQLATNLLGPTHQPPQNYLASLEAFIDRCEIRHLITAARDEIDEEPINQRIKAMNPDQIRSRQKIWQRTFQGTRFLKLLEQRSAEANVNQVD